MAGGAEPLGGLAAKMLMRESAAMSVERRPVPVRVERAEVELAFAEVQADLRSEQGTDAYKSWIEPLAYAGEEGGSLYFRAHTAVARDWLNRHAHDALEAGLRERLRLAAPVVISIEAELPQAVRAAAAGVEPPAPPVNIASGAQTFENFCLGDANRAAVCLARAIAEGNGAASQLVLFHGVNGVGKTHVINALANEARRRDPARRIRYMMATLFVDEFQSALQNKKDMAGFKSQMRDVDLLLLDDVQLIANKPATEHELFTTLSVIIAHGGRVVLTADHGPEGLEGFDVRLRNQLRAATDILIDAPDFELRRKILEAKVKQCAAITPGFHVPGPVLDMIASRVKGPGRALDSAIRQLHAALGLAQEDITMENAERVLMSRFAAPERRPAVEQIIAHTGKYFGLSKEQLLRSEERRVGKECRSRWSPYH